MADVGGRNACERACHRGFHRAVGGPHEPSRALYHTKADTAGVDRIAFAYEQFLLDQALNHARNRARVEPQDVRKLARANAGILADEFENEPLRSGNSDGGAHPLRGGLQSVLDGPQETHEIEHGVERLVEAPGAQRFRHRDMIPNAVGRRENWLLRQSASHYPQHA